MKEEKDVCLIDRRQPNSQASGSNAGSLHVQLLSYDFDPKNLQQVENLKNSLKLQKQGITTWKKIEKEISELKEAAKTDDVEKIKAQIESINKALQEIGTKIYQDAAQAQEQTQEKPEEKKEENVVDAEFEKEEKTEKEEKSE